MKVIFNLASFKHKIHKSLAYSYPYHLPRTLCEQGARLFLLLSWLLSGPGLLGSCRSLLKVYLDARYPRGRQSHGSR